MQRGHTGHTLHVTCCSRIRDGNRGAGLDGIANITTAFGKFMERLEAANLTQSVVTVSLNPSVATPQSVEDANALFGKAQSFSQALKESQAKGNGCATTCFQSAPPCRLFASTHLTRTHASDRTRPPSKRNFASEMRKPSLVRPQRACFLRRMHSTTTGSSQCYSSCITCCQCDKRH